MLENPTSAAAAAADPPANVKRYAPPSQRNRPLNRRKSADRFDRTNNPQGGSDLEKNQISSSRSMSGMDHGDASSSSLLNENSRLGLLALEGCSGSAAFQLLNNRWAAAMHCFNDPSVDLSGVGRIQRSRNQTWGRKRRIGLKEYGSFNKPQKTSYVHRRRSSMGSVPTSSSVNGFNRRCWVSWFINGLLE